MPSRIVRTFPVIIAAVWPLTLSASTNVTTAAYRVSECGRVASSVSSELCAQWRAVDIAQQAANYAFWSLIVSVIGVLAAGASIYFLIQTIKADKKRMVDELRAYVTISEATLQFGADDTNLVFTFQNYGSSPAQLKRIVYSCAGYEPDAPVTVTMFDDKVERSLSLIIPQSATEHVRWPAWHGRQPFSPLQLPGMIDELLEGKNSFQVHGVLEYVDVFGESRELNFVRRSAAGPTVERGGEQRMVLHQTDTGNSFS